MELFIFVYTGVVSVLCIILGCLLAKKSRSIKVISIEYLEDRITALEEKIKMIKLETASI